MAAYDNLPNGWSRFVDHALACIFLHTIKYQGVLQVSRTKYKFIDGIVFHDLIQLFFCSCVNKLPAVCQAG